MIITSKQNPLILHIKKLQIDKDYRAQNNEYILENPKNIGDILKSHPHLITQLIHSIPLSVETDIPIQQVTSAVMAHASSLKTPVGMMAIIKKNIPTAPLSSHPTLWVLDQLQDPSNIGAIIRNAVAFNISAILLTPGTTDPTHPKSVQASAGQLHHVDIIQLTEALWETDILPKFQVVTLEINGATPLTQFKPTGPTAFVFGSEGNGIITPYILESPHTSTYIPMAPTIDSLNVATTSGIIGYHLKQV
jgi:TrmH family RNA methyltransferase